MIDLPGILAYINDAQDVKVLVAIAHAANARATQLTDSDDNRARCVREIQRKINQVGKTQGRTHKAGVVKELYRFLYENRVLGFRSFGAFTQTARSKLVEFSREPELSEFAREMFPLLFGERLPVPETGSRGQPHARTDDPLQQPPAVGDNPPRQTCAETAAAPLATSKEEAAACSASAGHTDPQHPPTSDHPSENSPQPPTRDDPPQPSARDDPPQLSAREDPPQPPARDDPPQPPVCVEPQLPTRGGLQEPLTSDDSQQPLPLAGDVLQAQVHDQDDPQPQQVAHVQLAYVADGPVLPLAPASATPKPAPKPTARSNGTCPCTSA